MTLPPPCCKLATDRRPRTTHFSARRSTLEFAVMEDEAALDAGQPPAQKAAVKIQRMHRQNSFTSEDTDEKARRQWVNFHLENGQYEEALALGWDGDLEKTAQEPTPDSDAEGDEGAASDVADGTSGWSEEQAAASSKIAAVRRGSAARKERNDQQKGAVAIQSRFRNRHSRVKSEGSNDNGDGVGDEAEEGPFGGDTHPELSGSGSDFGDDDDRGDDSDGGDGGDGGEDGDRGNDGLGRETDAVAGDTAGGEGGVVHQSNGQRRRAAASVIAAHRKGAKRRQQDQQVGKERDAASVIAAHRKGAKGRQQVGKEKDAASVIAAHRKGAKRRQNLVQEAEEASVRASRLNALVGAKARQSSSEAVGAIETQSLPEPTSPSAPTTMLVAETGLTPAGRAALDETAIAAGVGSTCTTVCSSSDRFGSSRSLGREPPAVLVVHPTHKRGDFRRRAHFGGALAAQIGDHSPQDAEQAASPAQRQARRKGATANPSASPSPNPNPNLNPNPNPNPNPKPNPNPNPNQRCPRCRGRATPSRSSRWPSRRKTRRVSTTAAVPPAGAVAPRWRRSQVRRRPPVPTGETRCDASRARCRSRLGLALALA
eukprot:scaffold22210_cov58-Phaeocystis_antarctica.AAC.5